MYEIRDKNWRDVSEEGDNKKNIHDLRWDVYVKDKEKLIKREFSVPVPHTEGGGIVWTCVKDRIIDEKQQYEAIGLRGFYYKLFEEEEAGGNRERLEGCPYLEHLIQLWPVDWVKQMLKMNEVVGMNNRLTMGGGGKRIVCPFRGQKFWKCIGCVLSAVTYGKKGKILWSEITKYFYNKEPTKLLRDVRGYTVLYKVWCGLYCHFYIYACHWIILSHTTLFIYWIFLQVLTYIFPLQVCGIYLTRFNEFRTFRPCSFVDTLVKCTDNFWKFCGLIDRV